MIFERLQKEFEAARTSQTQGRYIIISTFCCQEFGFSNIICLYPQRFVWTANNGMMGC